MIETAAFTLKALGGRARTLRVWTPAARNGRHFPVLYMHDAQNLFRDNEATYGTCWRLGETLEALGLELIVAALDSNPVGHGRLDELSPWTNEWIQHKNVGIDRTVGGEGDAYLEALVDEVKPWVDERYPTRPERLTTFLAGSSMGGLISLYGACRHPEIFSRAACFSSAFWYASDQLEAFVRFAPLPDRVYLDIGTAEGSRQHNEEERRRYVADSRSMHALLSSRGLGPERLRLVVDEGGEHNEAAWARRLPAALRWWLSDFLPVRS